MKFNDKYPQAASLKAAFPDQLMGPHPEVRPSLGHDGAPDTAQSWRNYPCAVCGEVTGWRIDVEGIPPAALCSEECHIQFLMGDGITKEGLARIEVYMVDNDMARRALVNVALRGGEQVVSGAVQELAEKQRIIEEGLFREDQATSGQDGRLAAGGTPGSPEDGGVSGPPAQASGEVQSPGELRQEGPAGGGLGG